MKKSSILFIVLFFNMVTITGFLFWHKVESSKTISILHEQKKMTKIIPILSYHCIDNKVWGIKNLFVSIEEFQKQMKYLKDNNYTIISFNQIKSADKINKPIILTFDDGYEDNYLYAYPILKKYNFKATIFLISGYINKKLYLKTSEIKKMSDIIDFQDHTVDHPHLRKLSSKRISYEMSKSKKVIESITGKKVYCIAYPYGDYNKRVIMIAKKYFQYAVTTKFGLFNEYSKDDYDIKRIDIKINRFIRMVKI